MAGLATAMRNSILDMLFNQTNITAPTAIHLSLHTADPGVSGANEVSGSAYARQNVTASFPAASGGTLENNVAVVFPTVTSPAYTVTHWGLWSASSAGTYYYGGAITPNRTHAIGTVPRFEIGEIDLSAA
jgi:hypothetical protein